MANESDYMVVVYGTELFSAVSAIYLRAPYLPHLKTVDVYVNIKKKLVFRSPSFAYDFKIL